MTRKLPIETSAPTYVKIPTAPKIKLGCFQIESLSPARCSACSIFGNLNVPIAIASSTSATQITVYGIFTEAASCTRYAYNACGDSLCNSSIAIGAVARISSPPSFGAMVVPNALNACVKSSRLDAVSGLPSTTT